MIVLEVGFKLNESLDYYKKILQKHNAINCFNCETRDIYYTRENLDGLSENEMKNQCIRLRLTRKLQDEKWSYRFQNFHLLSDEYKQRFHAKDSFEIQETEYEQYINIVEQAGFKKYLILKKLIINILLEI